MMVLNKPSVPYQLTKRQLMKARKVFVQSWNYLSWPDHPACLHSESVTLCLSPCVTPIWKDKLSPGNSHRAVYGVKRTLCRSNFTASSPSTQTARSPMLAWDWSAPTLLCSSSSCFIMQPSQPLLPRASGAASELWSDHTTWCTMHPAEELQGWAWRPASRWEPRRRLSFLKCSQIHDKLYVYVCDTCIYYTPS